MKPRLRAASEFASLRWAGVGVSARLAELVTSLASDVEHGIFLIVATAILSCQFSRKRMVILSRPVVC